MWTKRVLSVKWEGRTKLKVRKENKMVLNEMLENFMDAAWMTEAKYVIDAEMTYEISDWMCEYIGFSDFLE